MAAALGQAAVAGAGLGLALLGAHDIAAVATAAQWLNDIQRAYADSIAAAGGGLVGISVRLLAH